VRGGLALRHALEVHQLDRLALLGRQLGERGGDAGPGLPLRGGLVGRVGAGRVGRRRAGPRGGAGAAAAQAVDRAAVPEHRHPGYDRAAAGIEGMCTVPHLDEGLLDHVVGVAGVAQGPGRHRAHPRREPIVQPAQRRRVAGRDLADDRWVDLEQARDQR
jgi:hypothetical protein